MRLRIDDYETRSEEEATGGHPPSSCSKQPRQMAKAYGWHSRHECQPGTSSDETLEDPLDGRPFMKRLTISE